ncbi:MAG: hypothetical protein HN348_30020, partial [Proteobacteria bacterium]|nr:hypothetical protein [Pseudomonadota bacterium]
MYWAIIAIGLFWAGLATAATLPQSPHANQMQVYGSQDQGATFPVRAPLPDVNDGPDIIVYGYQAYWDDDLNAVPWDDISHIALFSANANTSGGLDSTSRWDEAESAV